MVAAQSALMTVLVFISRRAKSSVFLSAFVFVFVFVFVYVFVYVFLSDDDRAKCVGCCLIGGLHSAEEPNHLYLYQ